MHSGSGSRKIRCDASFRLRPTVEPSRVAARSAEQRRVLRHTPRRRVAYDARHRWRLRGEARSSASLNSARHSTSRALLNTSHLFVQINNLAIEGRQPFASRAAIRRMHRRRTAREIERGHSAHSGARPHRGSSLAPMSSPLVAQRCDSARTPSGWVALPR